jgi:hypothetical protein
MFIIEPSTFHYIGIRTPRLNRLASIFIIAEQAHKEAVLRQISLENSIIISWPGEQMSPAL